MNVKVIERLCDAVAKLFNAIAIFFDPKKQAARRTLYEYKMAKKALQLADKIFKYQKQYSKLPTDNIKQRRLLKLRIERQKGKFYRLLAIE